MYNQNRLLVIALAIAFVVEQIVMVVSLISSIPHIKFTSICISVSVPDAVTIFG
jgi:hypothetical protein